MPASSTVGSPEEVLAALEGVRTAAICGHMNPDGDCIGSNLALAAFLRTRGIETASLLAQEHPAPRLYEFLEGYELIPASAYSGTPDLFIVVDAPNLERIGDGAEIFKRAPRTIAIDHHPFYEGMADVYYGDTSAPATGTLIWRLFQKSGITPTKAMATCCYVAVMTDTGRFSFQNTNAEAFEQAAQMIRCGAEPTFLSQKVYEDKLLGAIKLESRLVERMRFLCDGDVVWSWVCEQDFRELEVEHDDTESLPTILRSIAGVQVAALLREEEGTVRVNLRSRGGCNVGEFARGWDGGGHKAAAGLTLHMTLDEARTDFLPKLAQLVCSE